MDTLTLKALSMALNHETTDEVIRLRKENKELKEKLNRIESNIKKIKSYMKSSELITELVNDKEEQYLHQNMSFEEILDDEIADECGFQLDEKQKPEILRIYEENKQHIVEENFDDGFYTSTFRHSVLPIFQYLDKSPEAIDYLLKKHNPFTFEFDRPNPWSSPDILLPNFTMYVDIYKFNTENEVDDYYKENKEFYISEDLHNKISSMTFEEKQKQFTTDEINGGLPHRCEIMLKLIKDWKDNGSIPDLTPKIVQQKTNVEVSIGEFVDYYLHTKSLADDEPLSPRHTLLVEYINKN